MDSLFDQLKNSKTEYNDVLVSKLIKHNRKKYGEISSNTKKIIFFMMKKIILKGVNQFMSQNKKRKNETPYEHSDMVIEIYFVLEKCLDKFDLSLEKNFYLYFNQAVTRRMSRMANYKSVYDSNHQKVSLDAELGTGEDGNKVTYKDFVSNKSSGNGMPSDLSDVGDILFLGFEKIDIEIMQCMINKETRSCIERKTKLNGREIKERIELIKQELGQRYGW